MNFSEEIIVIFMFYNFIKTIIFGSVVELIWPTQFFNRRNNINSQLIRFRTYVETVTKLRLKNQNYRIFNKSMIKYFFLKQ